MEGSGQKAATKRQLGSSFLEAYCIVRVTLRLLLSHHFHWRQRSFVLKVCDPAMPFPVFSFGPPKQQIGGGCILVSTTPSFQPQNAIKTWIFLGGGDNNGRIGVSYLENFSDWISSDYYFCCQLGMHGLLETWMGVIQNLRKKITIGSDQLDAKLYNFSLFGRFQCWPCQI